MSILQKIRFDSVLKGDTKKMSLLMVAEIILITLGITLALQFEEWSVLKEDQITKQQYLLDLKEELESDIELYIKYDKVYDNQSELIKGTITIMSDKYDDALDRKEFLQNIYYGLAYGMWTRSPIVFNELKSTGKMLLIDNQLLKVQLHNYYNRVNEFQTGILLNMEKSINDSRDYMISNVDILMAEELFNDQDYLILNSVPSLEAAIKVHGSEELQKHFKKYYAYTRASIMIQKTFVDEAEVIIKTIETELDIEEE